METTQENGTNGYATPGSALALRTPYSGGGAMLDAYTPRTIDDAMKLAKTYAASKILGSYGTQEQVMLIMATGAELGIPPTSALRGLYVVEGRVFMSADLMVALCLRAPQCERFQLVENDSTHAVYEVKRKGGESLRFGFSVEDAARAGLGQKEGSNWKKYPNVMCRHRAAAQAARAVFPDIIMGLYDENEAEAMTPATVSPLPTATAAPARAAAASVEDAEIVENPEARIIRLLAEATSADDLPKISAEAKRLFPDERPLAVKEAYAAAKRRLTAAAERTPGADDDAQ